MRDSKRTPTELRLQFGANLRQLSETAPSVAQLCRNLGINRTQFNRYLKGDAFPRPDVLERICRYFGVDARILLEPLDNLRPQSATLGAFEELNVLLAEVEALDIPVDLLPDGVYLHRRVSYFSTTSIHCSMFSIRRDDYGVTRIRGYTPVAASERLGFGRKIDNRRFKGLVFRQMLGCSFVLTMERVPMMVVGGFEPNYLGNPRLYFGSSIATQDVLTPAPILLERLAQTRLAVLQARHCIGIKSRDELSPVLRGYFDRYAPLPPDGFAKAP